MEWPAISRTSSITSDRVLIDISNGDEFDKCIGTPKIVAEHASAVISSEVPFLVSTHAGLSVKHKTQNAASQDLEKSKAKPTPTLGSLRKYYANFYSALFLAFWIKREATFVISSSS
jgi:hypothetical protein